MANNSPAATVNGKVILRGRLRKGMTLRDLDSRCRELGRPVHYSFLSRIERGLGQPSPHLLPVLAAAIGLEVDDLFTEDARPVNAA